MISKVKVVLELCSEFQFDYARQTESKIDLLEWRADLLGATSYFTSTLPIIFALRSKKSGGNFSGTKEDRILILIEASKYFDFVELESNLDLIPEILNHIPAHKRRIATYTFQEKKPEIGSSFLKLQKVEATHYKYVHQTESSEEAVEFTSYLTKLNTNKVTAFVSGLNVLWTQILAPFIGSAELYCSPPSNKTVDSHPCIERFQSDYNLPHIYPVKELFGIVGDPIYGSISPKQHNRKYRELQLPYLYLPFLSDNFSQFKSEMLKNSALPIPITGLTVVSPLKEQGFRNSKLLFGEAASLNSRSCNGIVKNNDRWDGFSTDAVGAIEAIENHEKEWANKRIAVIGCGGAGKTILSQLSVFCQKLTLVNRTIEKGQDFANILGIRFQALQNFQPQDYDIIVNATPLGKAKNEKAFDVNQLKKNTIVVDYVYSRDRLTSLIEHCKQNGIAFTDGKEMANIQIAHQFQKLTKIPLNRYYRNQKSKVKT